MTRWGWLPRSDGTLSINHMNILSEATNFLFIFILLRSVSICGFFFLLWDPSGYVRGIVQLKKNKYYKNIQFKKYISIVYIGSGNNGYSSVNNDTFVNLGNGFNTKFPKSKNRTD